MSVGIQIATNVPITIDKLITKTSLSKYLVVGLKFRICSAPKTIKFGRTAAEPIALNEILFIQNLQKYNKYLHK